MLGDAHFSLLRAGHGGLSTYTGTKTLTIDRNIKPRTGHGVDDRRFSLTMRRSIMRRHSSHKWMQSSPNARSRRHWRTSPCADRRSVRKRTADFGRPSSFSGLPASERRAEMMQDRSTPEMCAGRPRSISAANHTTLRVMKPAPSESDKMTEDASGLHPESPLPRSYPSDDVQ